VWQHTRATARHSTRSEVSSLLVGLGDARQDGVAGRGRGGGGKREWGSPTTVLDVVPLKNQLNADICGGGRGGAALRYSCANAADHSGHACSLKHGVGL
jgi:hypothetical protein